MKIQLRSTSLSTVGKAVGLALFVAILVAPSPQGLPPQAKRLAAVTVLMATLWLTQAIPIAVTSLLQRVAFPMLGIQTADAVSQSYINKNIFLFLGGFIIALGIEKWDLHQRMALHLLRVVGTSLRRVVLGFMLATAFLSMWISNTASTLLMLPIGLALLASLRDLTLAQNGPQSNNIQQQQSDEGIQRLSVVLMLAIAYSASIGGFTTLVGTPTNVQFQQIWSDYFPKAPELSAGEWMAATVPLGVTFLLCSWGVLVWRLQPIPGARRFDRRFFTEKLRALGAISCAEIRMLFVFATTAALWLFRKPLRIGSTSILPGWGDGVQTLLEYIGTGADLAASFVHDSTVAIGMVVLMFFIPAEQDADGRVKYLMDWKTTERLPWGILLLIGGGFALANAFRDTGLSEWVGQCFAETVNGWKPWMLVMAVCLLMTFLTELTSNVATVSAILPILAGTAVSLGIDPRLIMIPATVSTSCAFMLPIATPPNAIVFGSGKVSMGQMVRYGLALNVLGVVLITSTILVLLVPQLDILLKTMPDWAQPLK